MNSSSPTESFANVIIAQDEHVGGDIAQIFHQQLRGHPKIKSVCLSFATRSGSQSCVPTPLNPDLGSRVDSPDPLVAWVDILVVALGADALAKMLHGITNDSFLLGLLRSWDVSKKIILVPCMSKNTWENPMTRKQLSKIRRKWNWIRVLAPMFSFGGTNTEADNNTWAGMDEMIKTVRTQAEILTMGHDIHVTDDEGTETSILCKQSSKIILPLEILSMILEKLRDWELAHALGIFTNLAIPLEWERLMPRQRNASPNSHSLEWTILTHRYSDIVSKIQGLRPKWLSSMSVKLIFKFARADLLSYLEASHKDLFWSTFGQRLLPTKASAVFGKVEILEWWKISPSFLKKEYAAEVMDLASKAGFVHVLEWWRASGLQLRYTEAALEQAGSIEVLEWWRAASKSSPGGNNAVQLKVGRSLLLAAQNGQADFVRWWAQSGISTGHEDAVARTASTNGHVNVLQQWKACRGDKMQFDNQILVGPTRNAHVGVMEWWKQSGFRVAYKTCDIEEALEDSSGDWIRTWWAKNGLNLGVETSEWMKVKVL